MTTKQLDAYFRSFLDIDGFLQMDDSVNGLQVDNDGSEITKVAFAVDACLESFTLAAQRGAGMLFVHHGLLWGKPAPITGIMRTRLQLLMANNIALYGVHLPLDQHPEVGNNATLAALLGLEEREPFGDYHERKIGYKGVLPQSISIDEAVRRISFMGRPPLGVYPFGNKEIRTIAIVSGGAAMEAFQAVDEQVDLYITGEMSHSVYHYAMEGKLNMIAGGHYSTEVYGVRRVMEKLANEFSLDVEFLDIPTGL